MTTYCTHFDINYLPQGVCMMNSLLRHVPDADVVVVALDDECFDALIGREFFPEDRVRVLNLNLLAELLRGKVDVDYHRQRLPWREFCWLLEPAICRSMLDRNADQVAYVDADQFFFQSPEPVFESLPDEAIIGLTPHRFPPHWKKREQSTGYYNFGFGWFRVAPETREIADEWVAKTVESIGTDCMIGQRYLDSLPRTAGQGKVHELPVTINVGPWQLPQVSGDPPRIQNQPLICYHFHEMRRCSPEKRGDNVVQIAGEAWNLTNYGINPQTRESVYRPYMEELEQCVQNSTGSRIS